MADTATRTGTAGPAAAPDRTAPDRTAPHGTAPDRTAPDGTAPDRTAPDRSALDGTAPDGTAPDRSAPDRTALDGTASGRTGPPPAAAAPAAVAAPGAAPGLPGPPADLPADPRRWLVLGVLAAAELMVVLDGTVVNIAMPTAQADLGISDADRQWMVTAYTLAFGGLLLLGGRVADYWGRRRAFVTGVAGFAVASALGGLATTGGMLFAARALQGVFGALLVPAAGSLLTVLFSRPAERARAFAVYGAVAGSGSAIGLLVGGLLTEYANWRWCLLVNVPVAAAVVAAVALVPASRAAGGARYDLPGAVLGTAGLVAVVYGAGHAAEHGWTSGGTVAAGLVGAALLAAFAAVEARSAHPLLPVRIVLDRNRGGAYLASVLSAAGVLATFLFLTYYFQVVLGYGPVRAGLGALPITAGVLLAAAAAGRLMPLVGARPLIRYGALTAAAASLWLTRVGVSTGYLTHVLPAAVALGIGFGLVIVPLSNLALLGVPPRDAGAASAVFNATQQVGGSLGTAVLNTVCTVAVAGYLADHPAAVRPALVHGYTTAFWWGAALLLASAVAVSALLRRSAARPG